MRAIVTGTGSIALRHLRNLRGMFPEASLVLVSRRPAGELTDEHRALADEIVAGMEPALARPADLAIIASPAPFHVDQALPAIRSGLPLLIEKPLAHRLESCAPLRDPDLPRKAPILVGYCLRYHPLVLEMERRVGEGAIGRLHCIRADVGQYLPDWRPGSDYRQSVSAQAAMGGGALLELSHELDLVRLFAGLPEKVTALTARLGGLEIDVEDLAEVVMQHGAAPHTIVSSVHLDLLRRVKRRRLILDGESGSLELDFIRGTLTECRPTGEPVVREMPAGFTVNDLYLAEIEDLLHCRETGTTPRASLEDGFNTLRIAEAAARSAGEGRVVGVLDAVAADAG